MNVAIIAAGVFFVCCAIVIFFQIALALGAPWGHLAMGGRFPGKFPAAMRIAAVLQAILMAAMAIVVAERVGFFAELRFPRSLFWGVTVLTFVSTVANFATPSIPERKLWAPVATLMCVSCFVIAFLPNP